ncbi:hypothetical protein ES703_74575 [subsurface metagenome]
MFFTGYLPILGSGVEALMAEVLLKQPEAISRVIELYGVNSKGVS